MSWYRTGSASVTQGSTAVTGSGTDWTGSVLPGDGFRGPDGVEREIASVNNATSLTLAETYTGTTQSGAAYAIIPTQDRRQDQAVAVADLIGRVDGALDGPLAGRFGNGTVASPGIAFVGDPDTGFRRRGVNEIGLVAGGVDQFWVGSDGIMRGRPVQASPTDETAGRLLTPGAFGLGAPVKLEGGVDIQSRSLPPGRYVYRGDQVPGGPESAAFMHVLDVARRAPQDGGQHTYVSRRSTSGQQAMWVGGQTGPDTINWTRVALDDGSADFSALSIGGTPVIESGSNANGRFVRFADGTQMCWARDLYNDTVGADANVARTWTFPAAFASGATEEAACVINVREQNTDVGVRGAAKYLSASINTGRTSALWAVHNANATAIGNVRVDVYAVGVSV